MKKSLLLCLTAAVTALSAMATQRVTLSGTVYDMDTLFHAQVGPGTTQTSLLFHAVDESLNLRDIRAFYCAIDVTNPYVSLATVCAKDKVAGNETISGMARRKSHDGARYFIGINGDFFLTGGSTARGVSVIGTPVGATVVDGTIYRARNNASQYKNFLVDTSGRMYCNPFVFGGTLTTPGGTIVPLGGVNTYSSEASCANSVVIFNDLYYGSTDQTNDGVEIQARLVEGDTFAAAGSFSMVITGEPSTEGDMTIPDGGFVLRGVGTAADVLNTLHAGDVVALTTRWTFGDLSVDPAQVISGNPKIVGGGEVLDTEGDRGDASAKHPRSAIGYSEDGTTAYFLVIDGRSVLSDGARTSVVGQIIRMAGAYEAVNVDGGGSSVLYTDALGVRNVPSDGSERADANAFYAVHSAPADNTVAALRFVDWQLRVPKYGVYTPHVYGYNRYGVLIDTDVKGFTLSCPPELGLVRDDTLFVANGSGTLPLRVTLGNVSFEAPLTVVDTGNDLLMRCDSVINDGYRPWTVEVQSIVDGERLPVDASALQWTSSDPTIVSIDPDTGTLIGLRDGEAVVTGTLNEFSGSTRVKVQIPDAHALPIERDFDPTLWTVAASGAKDIIVTPVGDRGMTIDYTGSSSRSNYIRFNHEFEVWSRPDTLRLTIDPGEAPVTGVTFAVKVPGGNVSFQKVTPEEIPAGSVTTIDLPLDEWTDTDDMLNYPVTVTYIQLAMGRSTTGQQYTINIPAIEAIYAPVGDAPAPLRGDVNGDGSVNAGDVSAIYNMMLGVTEPDPARADLNDDSNINAADVSALYSIMLAE